MILNYDDFQINESKGSLKSIKKTIRGTLSRTDRAMLRKILRHNIVTFKFVKRDDTIRKAKGTLYPSYLPALRGGAPKPEHQFVYYDLDKHHWRSFRTFKFIKIVDIKSISSKSDTKKIKELDYADDEEMMKKHVKEVDLEREETKKEKAKEKELSKKHHELDEPKKVVSKHEESPREKTYKAGEKIPEKELLRRSSDFRKDTKKNKHTKEANDAFKKGELDDKPKESKHEEKKHEDSKHEESPREKTYKAGEKIPEDELVRRSADFRKDSKKNKHTKESNNKFKKDKKRED